MSVEIIALCAIGALVVAYLVYLFGEGLDLWRRRKK